MSPDEAVLHFSPNGLLLLNVCLALIMFGVALDLQWKQFEEIFRRPRSFGLGLLSQLLVLPLLTLALVYGLRPYPSLALGMVLVAVCPGGNVSNFFTHLARGNVALSVSLTTVVTLACPVVTPFNFALFASLLPDSLISKASLEISFWGMLQTIVLLIFLPLALGLAFARRYPRTTMRLKKPFQQLSLLVFGAFVIGAIVANFKLFFQYYDQIAGIVLLHNGVALLSGFGVARAGRLPEPDVRSLTIETGIQNSGLALALIFNHFNGLGGMALIAATWGVWHLISGLGLASFWGKKKATIRLEEE
ncbi:MAG: bile acid:sodium symporter family protein [Microscillaceae bacterium]|nr:bile acid:sodium symporter family protein [Microscillaceae bacterium]